MIPSLAEIRATWARPIPSDATSEELRNFFNLHGTNGIQGASVSETNALTVTTVYACIAAISDTMETLNPQVKRRRKSGGFDIVTDHPLTEILTISPNPDMAACTRRATQTLHAELWGNKYDWIVRNRLGEIVELWPLLPDRVKKYRLTDSSQITEYTPTDATFGDILYDVYTSNHLTATLPAEKIMHVPRMSPTGLMGQGSVALQRTRMEIGKALDGFEARYFGQGFLSSLIARIPRLWDRDKDNRLTDRMSEAYAGLRKSHGVMLVEAGMEIDVLNNRLDWAMLDERGKALAVAICGIYRVPPTLIGILDNASYSNATQLDHQYAKHCIQPRVSREENHMNAVLLTEAERRAGFVIEYNLNELYRTDIDTRFSAYRKGFGMGALNPNEIREREGLNPREDEYGNTFYVESSFMPVDRAVEQQIQETRETNIVELVRDRKDAISE